jgi:formylglycine-generating enzyme required for sulfatase activity
MPEWNIPPALAALNKFEVLGKLGEGGMGAVWKARRKLLQDVVAIKVMGPEVAGNPELRARFLREMRATVRLNHPHIVRAFDAEEVGELLYLVMEYVEGVSLQKLVRQKGPVPVAYACRWIAQAAEGLQHAHGLGMVHRDIKPANLMLVAKDKAVKVLDFGLVQVPSAQGASLARTQFQTFMGTPEYVAPEQATDARTADIRADIYSLGCTLFFLLAGRPPFEAETAINMILAHLEEEPPPLTSVRAEVPPGLSAVVARTLAKRPEDRYQMPAELAEALRPFTAAGRRQPPTEPEIGAPAKKPPPLPERSTDAVDVGGKDLIKPRRPLRAENRRRRVVALVGGVAAAVFAVVTAVILLMGEGRSPTDSPGAATPDKQERQNGALEQTGRRDALGAAAPIKGAELPALPREMENAIGMKLVKIPAGTFQMGSPEGAPVRRGNELPQHEVEISEFYLGVYEVTQAQFKRVMGYHPSQFSRDGQPGPGVEYKYGRPTGRMDKVKGVGSTDEFPVDTVSWGEAVAFCVKLNKEDRKKINGWVYRLPTEAEWEYACRGGASVFQAFAFGDSLSSSQANFDGTRPFGGAAVGLNLERPTKVGSYKPNGFGLYDMHGNVTEWCADWYGEGYYAESPRRDPRGPPEGSRRVSRGGGFNNPGGLCRSAVRFHNPPEIGVANRGFRVALVPPERK